METIGRGLLASPLSLELQALDLEDQPLQASLPVYWVNVPLKPFPDGPCTHIAYTLGPMYLYREYFKANVYTM